MSFWQWKVGNQNKKYKEKSKIFAFLFCLPETIAKNVRNILFKLAKLVVWPKTFSFSTSPQGSKSRKPDIKQVAKLRISFSHGAKDKNRQFENLALYSLSWRRRISHFKMNDIAGYGISCATQLELLYKTLMWIYFSFPFWKVNQKIKFFIFSFCKHQI